jgi:polyisoprenyl-phosphate glycosyltransferase
MAPMPHRSPAPRQPPAETGGTALTAASVQLSVVIPMHNEQDNLAALFARLLSVLAALELTYEVICVDDGSTDSTWSTLQEWLARRPELKLIRLSRNFGKEMAMTAGLRRAGGSAVVIMDADLQHPPEAIADFVVQWQSGAEMVIGVRRNRDTDPPLRRWLTGRFYRLINMMSEVRIPEDAGDFRLLDRRVVDALNAMPERSRFMKGLYGWVGFREVAVPFDTAPRHAGTSAFGIWRLFRFAMDGLASFTTVPLRMWSWLGAAVALPAVAYGAVIVVKTLIFGIDVPGYASLMVATLFLGGVQLICLGVLGDYVGRIFTEVKGRPQYLIAEERGMDPRPGQE